MRLIGIDILRGLAVSIVIIYHFYILLDYSSASSFQYIHFFGQLGVSLFFIISGYLIYRSIEHNITQKGISNGIKSYTIHRLFRILPAYYFNLIFVIFLAYFILHSIDTWSFKFIIKQLLAHLTFTSYFLYQTSGFEVNGAYWTLSIEMLWYIVAPFFFLFVKTNKTLILIFVLSLFYLASIDFGLMDWLFHLDNKASNYLNKLYFFSFQLPGQLIYFISGILIYKLKKTSLNISNNKRYILAVLIVLSFLYISNQSYFYTSFLIRNIFILFTVSTIFILFYQYHTKKLALLSWIGKISYSLYLWHMPLLLLIKKYIIPFDISLSTLVIIFLISLFSISSFSYYFIEENAFSLRKKFESK